MPWPPEVSWADAPRRARKAWIADRDGWLCAYCKRPLDSWTATLDHVIPRSKGGIDHPDNIVLACRRCNSEKADKRP